MGEIQWIMCPVCGSKTRLRIRYDTVLERFPLYCPKLSCFITDDNSLPCPTGKRKKPLLGRSILCA